MTSTNRPDQDFEVDAEFARQLFCIAETLSNLNYLILKEADEPEKVLRFAEASKESLQALVQLILPRLR